MWKSKSHFLGLFVIWITFVFLLALVLFVGRNIAYSPRGKKIDILKESRFTGKEIAEEDADTLVAAMVYCNRTLGFVNAPGLFQKVIADHLDEAAGLEAYKERRDLLHGILVDAGFSCMKPQGAFYLFAKCPIEDDAAFSQMAIKHNIILVGDSGFGYPGYFRLAYCVSYDTIRNSAQAFKDLYQEATGK